MLYFSDLPESVKNYVEKVPENSKTSTPPSPPPLPLKNSPMEFPQLDFADMSFDFGVMPDLPDMLHNQENTNNFENLVENQTNTGDHMDVDMDMDVQDWLDSLVVPLNNKMNPDQPTQHKEKKYDQNSWTQGV